MRFERLMDAVILFSHGSLLCGAGESLDAHAERLRAFGIAPSVEVGYLNYSEPLFGDTVARCAAAGATRFIVAPYFLVPGYFVKVDLPRAVEAVQRDHPDLEFIICPPLGYDESLADALIESAAMARDAEYWREDLNRAVASCRHNPRCPLYGSSGSGCLVSGVRIPGEDRDEGDVFAKEFITASPSPIRVQYPAIRHPLPFGPYGTLSALLVLVHGSPRPVANEEMFQVVETVRRRKVFPIVEVGFMECNEPTIPDAIESCIAHGATSIRAVPYFLHTGRHVTDDLPTALGAGRERHPDVEFRMGPYLGRSGCVSDLLVKRIIEIAN